MTDIDKAQIAALGTHAPTESLIPKEALAEIEAVFRFGARKYSPHGWKGREAASHTGHADNHICRFLDGETADHESGLHPLAHAAARLIMALWVEMDGRKAQKAQQDSVGMVLAEKKPR